jgi:hypothetical protein
MTAAAARPGASQGARPFLHGPELDAVSEVLLGRQYGHGAR